MNDQKILEVLAAGTDLRCVQIADKLEATTNDTLAQLRGLMAVGDVLETDGVAPNGLSCKFYNLSPAFRATDRCQAMVGKAAAASFESLPGATRGDRAVEFIRSRGFAGSATTSELHALLGLEPQQYVSAMLSSVVSAGRLVKNGKVWTLGPAAAGVPSIAPKPAPTPSPRVVAAAAEWDRTNGPSLAKVGMEMVPGRLPDAMPSPDDIPSPVPPVITAADLPNDPPVISASGTPVAIEAAVGFAACDDGSQVDPSSALPSHPAGDRVAVSPPAGTPGARKYPAFDNDESCCDHPLAAGPDLSQADPVIELQTKDENAPAFDLSPAESHAAECARLWYESHQKQPPVIITRSDLRDPAAADRRAVDSATTAVAPLRFGVWSDGFVELQRAGATVATLTRTDAEALADHMISLRGAA